MPEPMDYAKKGPVARAGKKKILKEKLQDYAAGKSKKAAAKSYANKGKKLAAKPAAKKAPAKKKLAAKKKVAAKKK